MDGQSISVINDIDSQYDCLSLSESDLENLDQIMPVINSIKGVWVDGTPLC